MVTACGVIGKMRELLFARGSRRDSKTLTAFDDRGTMRWRPFLVSGNRAVHWLKSMWSEVRLTISERRIAVSTAMSMIAGRSAEAVNSLIVHSSSSETLLVRPGLRAGRRRGEVGFSSPSYPYSDAA